MSNKLITHTIYLITNNLDGRNYVGKHKCLDNELPESRDYMGSGTELKKDQKKLGIKNFSKEVLAVCYDFEEVNLLERLYIALYRSIGKAEYNVADGGGGGYQGDEWFERLCKGVRDFYDSPEGEIAKERLREYRQNQVFTEEDEEKRIEGIHNFWHSKDGLEQRKINSEKQKGVSNTKGKSWYNNGVRNTLAFECPEGFVPGRLGDFTQSEETKQKKREYEKNLTPEQREARSKKIAAAHTGIALSEERKRKISEAKKGKPGREQSDEIKNRISEGMKGKKRFTNGIIEVRALTCPEGFVPGTLKGYLKNN